MKGSFKDLYELIELREDELSLKRFEFRNDPIPGDKATPISPWEHLNLEEQSQELFTGISSRKYTWNLNSKFLLFSDITKSIIAVEHAPSSIHGCDIFHSILSLKSNGPIYLENLYHTTVIAECHQLRIHDLTSCLIVANVENKGIVIENSSDLKFTSKEDCSDKRLQIDDFSWPTRTRKNPHYELQDCVPSYKWIFSISDGELDALKLTRLP